MIAQYRKQWLKWHNGYEKTAFRILRKRLKEASLKIPFERANPNNILAFYGFYLTKDLFLDIYTEIYQEIGLKHGKRVGSQINKQINQKDFIFGRFEGEWLSTIRDFFSTFGGNHIETVQKTYIDYLMEIFTKEFESGKTISEIADEMVRLIRSRNFYRWQALRIARTETTTASNMAAVQASIISGVIMEKVWISGQDARTRRPPKSDFDHYDMNGKAVPLNKPFEMALGEKLMFPGHQEGMRIPYEGGTANGGSAGNVINCRCTVAQRVKRDENGDIIRVDSRGNNMFPNREL